MSLATIVLSLSCAMQTKSVQSLPAVMGRDEAIVHTRSLILRAMKKDAIPGLSIVVSDANGILFAEGFGKADKEGKAFTADTISAIGSVSKLFTATAIMTLVQEGKLELDAPVSRYLPDFKPRTWGPSPENITVRSLLCHESGLQSDVLEGWIPGGLFRDQAPRPYANNAKIASNTTICYEPYTIWSYSNLGYSLLGLIVESASGMSFNDYVVKEVLAPIGMDSSSFTFRKDLAERYAQGLDRKTWVDIPAIRDLSAGSMAASAQDMGKFMTAVLRTATQDADRNAGGLLAPSALKEMWSRQNVKSALDFDMVVGLGWVPLTTERMPENTFYAHDGFVPPAFQTLTLMEPTLGLGVTLIINGADGSSLFSLGTESLRAFALSERNAVIKTASPVAKSPELPLPPELAAKLVGNWASANGLMKVLRAGKGLKLSVAGHQINLVYHGDGVFSPRMKFLGITLPIPALDDCSLMAKEYRGKDYLLFRSEGMSETMEKIEPIAMDDAWKARMGTWVPRKTAAKDDAMSIKLIEFRKDKETGLYLVRVRVSIGEAMSDAVDFPIASRSAEEIYLRGYGRNLGTAARAHTENGIEYIECVGLEFVRKK